MGSFGRPLLALLLLSLFLLSCIGSSAVTPTPQDLFSNADPTCGDNLILQLHHIQLHRIDASPIDLYSNQMQMLVFISNGAEGSEFNYNYSPIEVTSGTEFDFGRFHTAIDIRNQDPVYVWLLVVDKDEMSIWGQVAVSVFTSLAGVAASAGLTALVPGAGPALLTGSSIVTDLGSNLAVLDITQDDIIGDVAYLLDDSHNWGIGTHTVSTANDAVTLHFSIQRYNGCENSAALARRNEQTATPIPVSMAQTLSRCADGANLSRIGIGDMVISNVVDGRFNMFHAEPIRATEGIRYGSGHIFRVIEGPTCDYDPSSEYDTMFWLVVDGAGRRGWIAESEYNARLMFNAYLLTPISDVT